MLFGLKKIYISKFLHFKLLLELCAKKQSIMSFCQMLCGTLGCCHHRSVCCV